MPLMYPFTSVMIDGDLEAAPSSDFERPDTDFAPHAEIRVQPAGYFITQHVGPVLQFVATDKVGPFHHFATDVRRQWAGAKRLEELEAGQ